jgi:hypothetical protein
LDVATTPKRGFLVLGLGSQCGMDQDWRPIAELKPGHYAVGLLDDGHEINIYRAGGHLLNVATGAKIDNATGWQKLRTVTERPISFTLKGEL